MGSAPLTAPESRAVYDFTLLFSPERTLSYHTQGRVIFWNYLDRDPPGAKALAERFAALSGYTIEDAPYSSGFAGYKDWYIQEYDRPGVTIEAGRGENPLPMAQVEEIYRNNIRLLLESLKDEIQ